MKIAIYGRTFSPDFLVYILQVFDILKKAGVEIIIYKPFLKYIHTCNQTQEISLNEFESPEKFPADVSFIISIGGDGTFLETIPYALKNDVPVIGINSGRLGFLANISKDEIKGSFDAIFNNKFDIELRSLLKFLSPENIIGDHNFALNEITIQKKGSSMITIDAFLNDEFMNTYWTDGLIVSTATGSTAYSLSAGGPIMLPGSGNLILAPIASHNLTVRPIIIPDDLVITLRATARQKQIQITADSRMIEVDQPVEFKICKADFTLKMVKLPNNSFYSTIRNKLMWGVDKRN